MKKHQSDLIVVELRHLSETLLLIRLTSDEPLGEILPGQFVQVLVKDSPKTFLRRPISVHYVDHSSNELWLLVNQVGEGTRHLSALKAGDTLNVIFPLGNGYSRPQALEGTVLLLGGGVGIAPLLLLGKCLGEQGYKVIFILGAKKSSDLVQLQEYEKYGKVCVATEDGSLGHKGFVTQHPVLDECQDICQVYTCGPKPMMMAVARLAKSKNLPLQVSLENKMACGVGACLCCVEETHKGNECVCTKGPVFDINELLWQI